MQGDDFVEHRRVSIALTAAGALAAAGGLLVFFVFAPGMASNCREAFPDLAFLFWPGLISVWIIAAVYLAAMVFYFRIVHRIGKDRSFCTENAREMRFIACCMGTAGLLWLLVLLLPHLIWHIHFGPAWLWFIMASLASFAVAILAWGLGFLLRRAVSFKEENDLTI